MAQVKIDGLDPYNGTYPLDLSFNFRDFREIKRITGIRAAEVMEALEAGDLDIVVALASIALRKAGVQHDPEVLFDAQIGSIEIDFGEEEAEVVEDPPTSADETQTDISVGASGSDSSNGMTPSPEISSLDSSGIPLPDSTSVPETSTT